MGRRAWYWHLLSGGPGCCKGDSEAVRLWGRNVPGVCGSCKATATGWNEQWENSKWGRAGKGSEMGRQAGCWLVGSCKEFGFYCEWDGKPLEGLRRRVTWSSLCFNRITGCCVENSLKGSKGNILSRVGGDLDQGGSRRKGEMSVPFWRQGSTIY